MERPTPAPLASSASSAGAPAVASELLSDLRAANERLLLATLRSDELAERAAQAEAIFNALPDAIARYDRQLRHVYLNPAAERFCRRPRSDLLGKTSAELGFPAGLASDWNAILADTFAHGASTERVFTFDFVEGTRIFHVRTIPERDAKSGVTSVVAIARDVTESEMYHRARADADRVRRLQAVTAAFSEAPTPQDIARVLAVQAQEALAARAVFVVLGGEAGKELEVASAVGCGPEVEIPAPMVEAVRTREPIFLDRYGDGDSLVSIPLTFNDRAFGAVGLLFRRGHDLAETDRSFIVSLARHSAQAIDRARLLESEREARREAEAANGVKDEFLATMSHELRTPLNAVMGWVTLLRADTTDRSTADRAIEAIDRNARTQARLVEDVLDVSRIMSGKLPLAVDTVDAAAIVSAAVDTVRPAAAAKKIAIELAIDDVGTIRADSARLQQIVWNLVSNAVKFTQEHGRVTVSVRRAASRVTIEVADTGMGVAAEFLPHVFERFRQFDASTTRKYGGLGLGLAIARHLVELHGGTIVAESEGVGRGATFRVELPTDRVRELGPPAPPRPPPPTRDPHGSADDLTGLRVLVIDDDDDARAILGVALQRWGADVVSARSAQAALRQTESVRPDVLVCDIGMPDTDGYTLLRRLRALPESAGGQTPAVAVSGFARSEDVRRAFDAGFQGHVAKPVDLGILKHVIASVVGTGKADRA